MSITPNTTFANGTYDETLFCTLRALEGVNYLAYIDNGIPHIGVGFNLQDLTVFNAVVGVLGIEPTANDRELYWYNQLRDAVKQTYASGYDISFALDSIMLARWGDTTDTVANKVSFFEINSGDGDTQLRQIFNSIIGTYEAAVNNFFGASAPADSNERIALVSMAYNSSVYPKGQKYAGLPNVFGDGIKNAIANGDRAEAWYEIRFNSNGDQNRGQRTIFANERINLARSRQLA